MKALIHYIHGEKVPDEKKPDNGGFEFRSIWGLYKPINNCFSVSREQQLTTQETHELAEIKSFLEKNLNSFITKGQAKVAITNDKDVVVSHNHEEQLDKVILGAAYKINRLHSREYGGVASMRIGNGSRSEAWNISSDDKAFNDTLESVAVAPFFNRTRKVSLQDAKERHSTFSDNPELQDQMISDMKQAADLCNIIRSATSNKDLDKSAGKLRELTDNLSRQFSEFRYNPLKFMQSFFVILLNDNSRQNQRAALEDLKLALIDKGFPDSNEIREIRENLSISSSPSP